MKKTTKMNPRENLLSLLKRTGYDYIPVEFKLCPHLKETFPKDLDKGDGFYDYFNMPWRSVDDAKLPATNTEHYRTFYDVELKDGTHIDEWGVAHEPGSEAAMHMTYMRHPMAKLQTMEELEAYPLPDYLGADYSHQKEQCDDIHSKGLAALGDMQMTIFEVSWYLRSMEQLMMDMIMDKEKAELIIDKVLEISTHRALSYAKAGCDILFFGDDIGMQSSILMSVDMYVEWFKPRLKKLIDTVKALNPDIVIFYHSCGFVEPFIPHLIEAGVDVLNPIQPECMDFAKLHKLYGDQISFHGSIGTQTTMPFGDPKAIEAVVKENLTLAGKKGGLFIAPSHLLEPEVPWENIFTYVKACNDFDPEDI